MRYLFVIAALLAAPAVAAAQSPTPGHGMSPLEESLHRGDVAFARHDLDAAATAYREAAQRDPRSVDVQLRLASVARARDDAASALGLLREALRLATEVHDDAGHGRALCGIGDVHEAQGHWGDAAAAWDAARTFGEAHPGSVPAALPAARLEALGRREQLAHDYAPVRDRIAERLRVNAAGAPTPAGMTPVAPR